tara:strand:+ start:295 stop:690 length:396 start_codon:yes stop_codon:yes gene_type:complete
MSEHNYKIYKRISGYLVPLSLKKNIPFKTKRIFIINGKKNYYRGDHAHHKCSQFLISISGSVTVEYETTNKKNKKKLSLNNKVGLLIKPKTWLKIKFNNNNSMLMVFCDREYEFKDYIENYKDFKKIIKKK